jgi:two-component system, LytTR family, sensor histidine kinase AlgZ
VHPILAERGRLGLYLLGWSPLAALGVVLLALRGEVSWAESLAVGPPLLLVYAYLCLAAWYVCRLAPLASTRPLASTTPLAPTTPLRGAGHWRPLRALALHLGAALLSSAVWVALGLAWAGLLGELAAFEGLAGRLAGDAPGLFAVGVPVYLVSAAVHYLIQALEASRDAESRALELRVLAREAELKALKAQLDPHFLFNALNTVSALAGSDPAAARKMAILLAEFLRRSLRLGGLDRVPLGEELAHAAGYLAIERVRFGERLAVAEEIEPASRACLVPPLLLQPLVENAVRHGIAQLLEGGVIRIVASLQGAPGAGARLLLAVENPCDPDHPALPGEGVGLANVEARLAARYPGEARVAATAAAGTYRVEIALPATIGAVGTAGAGGTGGTMATAATSATSTATPAGALGATNASGRAPEAGPGRLAGEES